MKYVKYVSEGYVLILTSALPAAPPGTRARSCTAPPTATRPGSPPAPGCPRWCGRCHRPWPQRPRPGRRCARGARSGRPARMRRAGLQRSPAAAPATRPGRGGSDGHGWRGRPAGRTARPRPRWHRAAAPANAPGARSPTRDRSCGNVNFSCLCLSSFENVFSYWKCLLPYIYL